VGIPFDGHLGTRQKPVPEGCTNRLIFRGLKPPAPSGVSDLIRVGHAANVLGVWREPVVAEENATAVSAELADYQDEDDDEEDQRAVENNCRLHDSVAFYGEAVTAV